MKQETPEQVMKQFDQEAAALTEKYRKRIAAAVMAADDKPESDVDLKTMQWYKSDIGLIYITSIKDASEASIVKKEIAGYGFFNEQGKEGYGTFKATVKTGKSILPADMDDVEHAYHRIASQLDLYPGTTIKLFAGAPITKIGKSEPEFKAVLGDDTNVLLAGGVIISRNGEWPVEIDGVHIDVIRKLINKQKVGEQMFKELIDLLHKS